MSDRNVYTAILNKALVIGERLVNASIRELAELAGIASHATVQTALRQLREMGLIRSEGRSTDPNGPFKRRSTQWKIATDIDHLLLSSGRGRVVDSIGLNHDLFDNGKGIGHYAHAVWVQVRAEPGVTAAFIAAETGFNIRTVKKHLGRLAKEGVVEERAGGWHPLDRDLDEVAAEYGSLGRGNERRDRHRAQRAAYDRGWGKAKPQNERSADAE